MNICTQDAKQGQYAQLCIQVPLDQLLITSVCIGKFHQKVLYEGINLLSYHCGHIGHYSSNCAYKHMHISSLHSAQHILAPTDKTLEHTTHTVYANSLETTLNSHTNLSPTKATSTSISLPPLIPPQPS